MSKERSLQYAATFAMMSMFLAICLSACSPVLADDLTVSPTMPTANCNVITVSGGAASSSCGPATVDGTASAMGNLATGTFGVSSTIESSGLGGGATVDSAVGVDYDFAVSGVTNGTAQFGISVNGTISSTQCPGTACATYGALELAGGETFTSGGVVSNLSEVFLNPGSTTGFITTSVINGDAVLSFSLIAQATCDDFGVPCNGSSDFLDPLSITGASLYDSNGTLVSDANFVSDSGFNPNAGNSGGSGTVPEPPSLWLLGSGLLALVGLSLKKTIA